MILIMNNSESLRTPASYRLQNFTVWEHPPSQCRNPSLIDTHPQFLTNNIDCIHIYTRMIGNHLCQPISLIGTNKALEVSFLVYFASFPAPSKSWMAAGGSVNWWLTVNCQQPISIKFGKLRLDQEGLRLQWSFAPRYVWDSALCNSRSKFELVSSYSFDPLK